jgi:rare lipoprotein A
VARRLHGQATYYGDKFAGRKTASGERYQPDAMTAAHKSLPFGTRVRVKRLDGKGEVVCVRINDRGPFGRASRIIDLSKAAAKELAMLRAGVVRVEVEVLGEDTSKGKR